MAFGFDITEFLKSGDKENVMAVRIDNSWDYKEKATNADSSGIIDNFYANYGGIQKMFTCMLPISFIKRFRYTPTLKQPAYTFMPRILTSQQSRPQSLPNRRLRNEYSHSQNSYNTRYRIDDMDGKTIKTFNGGQYNIAAGETKDLKGQHSL